MIEPVLRMVQSWQELQQVRNAVDRLNDVFEVEPEQKSDGELLRLERLAGGIELNGVTFSYVRDESELVLDGIDQRIDSGEVVAVVGRSGSGKSTLAKLILGLHQPTKGRVSVDGHDLRSLFLPAYRRRIGVVPQEVFLFSGTIRDNIALGNQDASLEQVVAAARLAGAHEFIRDLGLGYDTLVGERGMSLSGGQRQRIGLARALLGDPDILVLDEATSALDAVSERAIQDNLAGICRGRTTIIIAHRLSTIRSADRILVMERGTIAEQGTHAELLARGGLYRELVGEQLSQ
jgi:ATP-binding cassette subfamily B protein